jgi:hypothetical protein
MMTGRGQLLERIAECQQTHDARQMSWRSGEARVGQRYTSRYKRAELPDVRVCKFFVLI